MPLMPLDLFCSVLSKTQNTLLTNLAVYTDHLQTLQMAQIEQVASASTTTTTTNTTTAPQDGLNFQSLWDESKYSFTTHLKQLNADSNLI
jgi:hypothetical protein